MRVTSPFIMGVMPPGRNILTQAANHDAMRSVVLKVHFKNRRSSKSPKLLKGNGEKSGRPGWLRKRSFIFIAATAAIVACSPETSEMASSIDSADILGASGIDAANVRQFIKSDVVLPVGLAVGLAGIAVGLAIVLAVRRFKLTALFLIISALTFAGVATAINFSSQRSEEANVILMTTEQSEKDARLIADIVMKLLAGEGQTDSASPDTGDGGGAGAQLSIADFLASSNIVRLSLYELDGTNGWSSTPDKQSIEYGQAAVFNDAVSGAISSDLSKNRLVLDSSGIGYNADIVETFIPFMHSDQGVPVSILGVTRDVTNALNSRVVETRSAIFRTMMISLGVAFAILLGTILSADRHIWKQRVRAVQYEREIASQELAATKLDVENLALQETKEERAKFLATVSHELRTPLTSIMGFTDVLARHQDGPDRETNLKQLEIVKRNGLHLLSLINDLLDSGELQTGDVALKPEQFMINESLQAMVETMSPLIDSKRQKLEFAVSTDNALVKLDRRRIGQVLMNLVGNASKYSPDGTLIRVEASGRGHDMQLIIEDNGIGISEEDQRRLFTKFFRVDNEATRRVGGTGLGLAITKEIVEAHGGTISLWSELGVGTRMTINIPGCVVDDEQTRDLPEENWDESPLEIEHIQAAHKVIWGSAPRHGGFALEPAIGKLAAVPPTPRRPVDHTMPVEI